MIFNLLADLMYKAADPRAAQIGDGDASLDIPHTVLPSLGSLAWRRLRSDRVAMVSLVIVSLFLLQMVLSGTGLIAAIGRGGRSQLRAAYVSGAGEPEGRTWRAGRRFVRCGGLPRPTSPPEPAKDPLADALAAIRGEV
jgi:peptide/nickel transport system permease protein